MKTIKDKDSIHTQITDNDRKILGKLVEILGPLVMLNPIGHYASMNADEIWMTLVGQVCVMGSARHIERLSDDISRYEQFKEAVCLSVVTDQQHQAVYLSQILRQFSATRFHQKSADTDSKSNSDLNNR